MNIHIAETLLIPGARRPPDDGAAVVVHDATSVDGVALDPALFIDANTDAIGPSSRVVPSAGPLGPTGPESSDPPTSFLPRHHDHIDLPSGSVVNNEYEIDVRLGAGAMGEVYSARHLKLGKRVAIKVIAPWLSQDPAAVERFEQEARALARIQHPGIIDVLGFGELADGRAYFVMEHLWGESLEARLRRGRVPFAEALDVLDQMARALEAAHTHQVIHRDLKPANTFLVRLPNERRPIVKLLDFGLAKLAADVDARAERTQIGAVIGTALYLSPEQCRGPDVDHRTDIYALGCTAYELLLGRPPFHDAKTSPALISAHLQDAPPMPRSLWPQIPAQLDLVLFAMLAKDPAHRPTLVQLRHVIATVYAPGPTTPATARTNRIAGDPRRSLAPVPARISRTAAVVLTTAGLIGGIALGALAFRARSVRTPRGTPAPGVTLPGDAANTSVSAPVMNDASGALAPPSDASGAIEGPRAPTDAGVAPVHAVPPSSDAGSKADPPCQPPGPNLDPFGPPLCKAPPSR